jgi:hypothetical protein
MSETTEGVFPLEDSLCLTCYHRFSRVFIPLNYADYDININDFDLAEGEPLEIEQHTCMVLNQDLDCVVSQCNKYRPSPTGKDLISNFVF